MLSYLHGMHYGQGGILDDSYQQPLYSNSKASGQTLQSVQLSQPALETKVIV